MKNIVFFTGVQRFCRSVKDLGFEVATLAEPDEDLSSRTDLDYLVAYDPVNDSEDLAGLAEALKSWPQRDRVVAVLNRRERRVLEHAVLLASFGLTGLNLHQAQVFRDKYLMRRTVDVRYPELNGQFTTMAGPEPPPDLRFPVALKPRNLFKSILIYKCRNMDELTSALTRFQEALPLAARRHGVPIRDSVLVETWLEGQEVALDSVVDGSGRVWPGLITDLKSGAALGHDDYHVYARISPTELSDQDQAAVKEVNAKVAAALGIKNVALHSDIMVTPHGPKLVETGARIGGYRSEMAELTYGFSLDAANLSVCLGREPDLTQKFLRHTAVLEYFPPRPGKLRVITGLDRIKELPSFYRLKQRMDLGAAVGLAGDGYRCPVFVILNHANRDVFKADLAAAEHLVKVEVA
ncbi:MAG: ATP-grasp domain-containing protein [Deltaproteobacteria bacterium]|nr:ATP-grasp domain-containing protein [Deltaproteobacteria bacterium]